MQRRQGVLRANGPCRCLICDYQTKDIPDSVEYPLRYPCQFCRVERVRAKNCDSNHCTRCPRKDQVYIIFYSNFLLFI